VTSLSILNNGLNLVSADNKGTLRIFETKGKLRELTSLQNVHECRHDQSINQVISLSQLSNPSKPQSADDGLPLMVSCGADGRVVMSEYNLYEVSENAQVVI